MLAALATAAVLHMPDMPLHDPFILADKARGTYYLYTSNNPRMSGRCETGTMVYESRNLRDWAAPKLVYAMPKGGWAKGGAWAPEVHRWRGKYYLFTTFHDEGAPITDPAPLPNRMPIRRGTILAVADHPEGPFTPVNGGEPIAPANMATLDGTLYIDPDGKPWLVYSHEWTQMSDGTIEAIPLDAHLKAAGAPVVLFRASDAPWAKAQVQARPDDKVYVTDGPELFRSKDGHLLMLWSSWKDDGHGTSIYVQSVARSESGKLIGPWTQLDPIVEQDSGHGMLFHDFDGGLKLIVHRPFKNARGKLYDVKDAGDHLEITGELTGIDGDLDMAKAAPLPKSPCNHP